MDLPKDLSPALLLSGSILVVVNSAAAFIKSLPQKAWNLFLSRFSVTLEVPQNALAFDAVKKFLAEQPKVFRVRRFSFHWGPDASWGVTPAPGNVYFRYRGKFGVASRARRELQGGDSFPIFETLHLRFFLADSGLVADFLADAKESNRFKKPGFDINSYNGSYWDTRENFRFRGLDTVVVAEGVAEKLVEAVKAFQDNEAWYKGRGIPHRLGILLEGPPGNGKTSLVKAVAERFKMDLSLLPLSKLDDMKLAHAFTCIPSGCVVLEDIDCAFEGRESDEAGITLSGLLNAMDGVSSREGYVLFMTTNHPERLDPALIRPGRVDLRLHIGNMTPEQASRYFLRFYGESGCDLATSFGDMFANQEISVARAQNVLMQHRDDPRAGHEAMRRHIQAAGGL